MSLFPAYADGNEKRNDGKEEIGNDAAGPSWLNYPSQVLLERRISSTSSSSGNEISDIDDSTGQNRKKEKRRKLKKMRKKSKSRAAGSKNGVGKEMNELYVLDNGQTSKINLINQIKLTRPVYPSSNCKHDSNKKKKKKRKKTNKTRYFSSNNVSSSQGNDGDIESSIDVEEFMRRTEEFNKKLRLEPHNVSMWLEYVKLQDLGIGTKVGKAEKKLSILERALEKNGDSEDLLNEKMTIYEAIHPFEKVSNEAKTLLIKYPHNPVGWRWLIQGIQYNLSKMTAPGVLQVYERVMESLHRIRQHNTPYFLDILLQCMLFLRQAGLWEQLWLLTELYLELTYTTAGSGAFKITATIPEEEIQALEDTVLTSGLPLGALWLRTEHLRECVHFIPVLNSPDPQRTVFVDDLSGLLFPLGSATYSKVMCQALVSVKVPPLPMTDALYEYVGLKSIGWSLDSAEILLTANDRSRGIIQLDSSYLEACRQLLVGPQYLSRERIGAKEYFESVNKLFNCCIDNCAQQDISSLLVWQVRWWRYLVQNMFHENETVDLEKELTTMAKLLLKKYRHCLPLYTEYALLQVELGNFDQSLKVLKTAMDVQETPLTAGKERKHVSGLYKAFIELLLRNDFQKNKELVIKILVAMSFGEHVNNIDNNDELTRKALDRMSHITTELIKDIEQKVTITEDIVSLEDVLLTNDVEAWVSCASWFLYIVEGVSQSSSFLERVIHLLEQHSTKTSIGNCILEKLYETLLTIVNHYCNTSSTQFQLLQEIIDRAIARFPNNTYFLHLLASTKITNVKWLKICNNIISTKSPLACVLLVFILRMKLLSEEQQQLITKDNAHKRLSALIKRLTKEACTERCPLIWRLALQSSSPLSMQETKSIFFLALEKCPWVKVLYYEAATMLPEDLPQIQDLLIEKELRLHITPEELEILREDDPVTSKVDDNEKQQCIS